MKWPAALAVAGLALFLFTGCHSASHSHPVAKTVITPLPEVPSPNDIPAPTVASAPPGSAPAATAPVNAAPPPPPPPIRIKAGLFSSFTDSDGNVWLPDQGFADGETTDRPDDLQVANTKDPAFYRTERYSMTAFSYPVPNGKYTVKLHFAETFDSITGPGERVFSFNVEGQEFKDFDIYVKAGGAQRACIETVIVEVTDGKLDITFTPKEENPEINGIEILPAS
jgi:endoglucanase